MGRYGVPDNMEAACVVPGQHWRVEGYDVKKHRSKRYWIVSRDGKDEDSRETLEEACYLIEDLLYAAQTNAAIADAYDTIHQNKE